MVIDEITVFRACKCVEIADETLLVEAPHRVPTAKPKKFVCGKFVLGAQQCGLGLDVEEVVSGEIEIVFGKQKLTDLPKFFLRLIVSGL
ncbi:hypothetical protein D3C72_2235440 [compost metagenome]